MNYVIIPDYDDDTIHTSVIICFNGEIIQDGVRIQNNMKNIPRQDSCFYQIQKKI